MEINYKRILDLATRGKNHSKKHRKLSNEVGEILNKINPDLEEQLRDGHSFLDEYMDYGNGTTSVDSIKREINEALKELKK